VEIPIAKPLISAGVIENIKKVILSGNLAQGCNVQAFEKAFALYVGTKYAIATNSGTSALHLAILAAGIGKGDEVITTPFSFISTATAVIHSGARPVFADVDPLTFNINPDHVEAKITPHTRAIIAVHLYGQMSDICSLTTICKRYNLVLIEDACQAHGAQMQKGKAGSFGIGCFSFYPTKNMTTGEGGMITTNDENIALQCNLLRSHGQTERYRHAVLGHNARMTEIAATIGLSQLEQLDSNNNRRIKNARLLSSGLKDIEGLALPRVLSGNKHVFHQYTVRVREDFKKSRDELKNYLENKGIGCGVYYPVPIHHQPLFHNLGFREDLPHAERAADEVLSLPVHPSLDDEDLDSIIKTIKSARYDN